MDANELKNLGACQDALDYFSKYNTWEKAVKNCSRVDWLEFLIDAVKGPALEEFDKVRKQARSEYRDTMKPARAEYDNVKADLKKYKKIQDKATAKYNKVCLAAAKKIALTL